MAQSDLLSRASFSIQGIWVLLPCTTLCTWAFLPSTLFFSFGYGLFCLCTWAFLTFTLVCRHFCPSQKAQIPKSHKIVTLMLICHIYIRDFIVLPHNKYIWRFINLFLAWFFTASQKFSRLLWMYTTSHAADPLFQHYPVAPDESHTDCVTLGGKR